MCDLCAVNLPSGRRMFVAAFFAVFVPALWCLLVSVYSYGLRQVYLETIYAWKLPEYWDWVLMGVYAIGILKMAKWSLQTGIGCSDWLAARLR